MDDLAKFPQKFAASSKPGAAIYTLLSDRYAVHLQETETAASGAEFLPGEGKITVFKGEPRPVAGAANGKLSGVYTLTQGGTPSVPTGLVFVRLADGLDVNDRTKAFADAGYEVADRLAYASNAAWLRSQSGDIAEALNGIGKLEKLPDVESVEPQMLMESARR